MPVPDITDPEICYGSDAPSGLKQQLRPFGPETGDC